MKIMKRFIALFLSLTMLSTSVAFAGESAKSHFSAFADVPSEVAPQSDLDAVSGQLTLAQIGIGAAVLFGGLWYANSNLAALKKTRAIQIHCQSVTNKSGLLNLNTYICN